MCAAFNTNDFFRTDPVTDIRAIHLDLKGCQPTFARLMELLDLFSACRYNAVLVEWEDTFPWTVDKRFRSPTAYTPDEIKTFVEKCAKNNLEIIPLVQCLGHMETPLGIPDYTHLREVPEASDVLNVLAEGARELVQNMVDDVLELIPAPKFFHLGGDEAWSFGKHPDTAAYIEKHNKGALYLRHVEPILDKLNAINIRPILWNDMINKWEDEEIIKVAQKADICVWGYSKDLEDCRHSRCEFIEKFSRLGVTTWGAGAYKGASGHNVDLADYKMHEDNALQWANVAKEYGYAGLIATAWSRYSTNRIQCEPIDANLDSLVNVGMIFHNGTIPENKKESCKDFLNTVGEGDLFVKCHEAAKKLSDFRKTAWAAVQDKREKIFLNKYDKRRTSNDICISLEKHMEKLPEIEKCFMESFAGLMPDIWIKEYLATRLEPLREEYNELVKSKDTELVPV